MVSERLEEVVWLPGLRASVLELVVRARSQRAGALSFVEIHEGRQIELTLRRWWWLDVQVGLVEID